jgi:DNA polymerase (family 10)
MRRLVNSSIPMSRISLGRAHQLASTILRELQSAGIQTTEITTTGSLRRFSPDVGDVGLFAAGDARERELLLRTFTRLPSATGVLAQSESGATVTMSRGEVTMHVAPRKRAGPALAWLTGSVGHVHALASLAEERGLRFAAARLVNRAGEDIACDTEEAFYGLLGLPLIPPEVRHGDDEIAAARDGRLPVLLSSIHMRGDLHMHSTWSDGRDTIEEMARASAALGYEYIAITDHSQRAGSSRKLAVADIPRQREEIDRVRRQYPRMRILHGIEVDIMKDGTLDFDDEVLAEFDIVLASLHDHGGQPGDQLTERYLRAIASPYVDVITHPTGRTPLVSDGYDLDLDRIFAAAAETGTAMEIDGAPGHLDMDGAIARRAALAGVTIVVDSDCHRAEWLRRQMRFGVGTARRGWIEPRHVLNTEPVRRVLEFVARKRARA